MKNGILFSACVAISIAMFPQASSAASYKKLVSQGYKTSKLTRSRSGSMGWFVSGRDKKYFCKMRGGSVYIGGGKMGIYTSAGRLIPIDRDAYHSKQGVKKTDAPQLKDLKAGRPRPQDVGACSFAG
ncbi:hypothetical protein DCO57_11405 [Labrenzia sp. 011]|nr:hypothetical protein DCO57_11405 [Labrenzia sp. 011]